MKGFNTLTEYLPIEIIEKISIYVQSKYSVKND